METLITIFGVTGDKKYLKPIAPALRYYKASVLSDGMLARYYELKSNRPLFMTSDYRLTYDDADVPAHYGWKRKSRLSSIEKNYQQALSGSLPPVTSARTIDPDKVRKILAELDDQGRWVSTYRGESLTGQPKFSRNFQYLSSRVFADNLEDLSTFLGSEKK